MGLPRSQYVQEDQEGVFHCFCRCVRRTFLTGYDAATNQDFSHRKAWVVDRMKFLAGIFAIDVCAFAVLANHFHSILRTGPDLANSWSDREVAVVDRKDKLPVSRSEPPSRPSNQLISVNVN
jgi:putative transposase